MYFLVANWIQRKCKLVGWLWKWWSCFRYRLQRSQDWLSCWTLDQQIPSILVIDPSEAQNTAVKEWSLRVLFVKIPFFGLLTPVPSVHKSWPDLVVGIFRTNVLSTIFKYERLPISSFLLTYLSRNGRPFPTARALWKGTERRRQKMHRLCGERRSQRWR